MQRIRALQSSGILCYLALEWWYYYYQRRRVARLITSAPPMNIHKNTRAVVALVQKNGGMQAVLTRVLHLGKTLRHVQHMQTAENVEQMMVGAESSDLHPAHVLRPLLWSIRGALVHATSDGTYSVWSKWVKGTRPIVLRPRRCTTRRSVSVGRYILWKSPTLDRVPPGRTVISRRMSSVKSLRCMFQIMYWIFSGTGLATNYLHSCQEWADGSGVVLPVQCDGVTYGVDFIRSAMYLDDTGKPPHGAESPSTVRQTLFVGGPMQTPSDTTVPIILHCGASTQYLWNPRHTV